MKKKLKSLLKNIKGDVKAYLLDTSKEGMVKAVTSDVLKDFIRIGVLVNNIEASIMNWSWELTEE
jgi:short-subunit dehydrogenase